MRFLIPVIFLVGCTREPLMSKCIDGYVHYKRVSEQYWTRSQVYTRAEVTNIRCVPEQGDNQ
jgi:hypothetical protein